MCLFEVFRSYDEGGFPKLTGVHVSIPYQHYYGFKTLNPFSIDRFLRLSFSTTEIKREEVTNIKYEISGNPLFLNSSVKESILTFFFFFFDSIFVRLLFFRPYWISFWFVIKELV